MNAVKPPSPLDSPGSDRLNSVKAFLAVLLGLVVLRMIVGLVPIPASAVIPASLIVTVLFVASPIYALFRAASIEWVPRTVFLTIVSGVVVWLVGTWLGKSIGVPVLGGFLSAIGQQAIVVWCLGIGAALALLMKDKNLLLPIAIFLALFDMWLVFAPEGIVNQTVVRGTGEALAAVGYQVPAPQTTSAGGRAAPLLFVGPADYLFLSMFFVAIHRFGMRTRETFRASVPVLAAYLLVVLLFGGVQLGPIRLGALPALVPIGLVVLIVNRKEFKLKGDEKIATLLIAILGSIFVAWRIFSPIPVDTAEQVGTAAPSKSVTGPESSGPPRTP